MSDDDQKEGVLETWASGDHSFMYMVGAGLGDAARAVAGMSPDDIPEVDDASDSGLAELAQKRLDESTEPIHLDRDAIEEVVGNGDAEMSAKYALFRKAEGKGNRQFAGYDEFKSAYASDAKSIDSKIEPLRNRSERGGNIPVDAAGDDGSSGPVLTIGGSPALGLDSLPPKFDSPDAAWVGVPVDIPEAGNGVSTMGMSRDVTGAPSTANADGQALQAGSDGITEFAVGVVNVLDKVAQALSYHRIRLEEIEDVIGRSIR